MANKIKVMVIGSGIPPLDYAKIEAQLAAAGFSIQECNEAFIQLGCAMKELVIPEDFMGRDFSSLEERAAMHEYIDARQPRNRDHGWYRQFEKKNGKRNL